MTGFLECNFSFVRYVTIVIFNMMISFFASAGDVVPQYQIGDLRYQFDGSLAYVCGMNNKDLIEITIPSRITYNHKSYLVISILPEAFKNASLVKCVVSEGIFEIGAGAFMSCKHLKEVKLPNSIWRIERETFKDCDSLTSVSMDTRVSFIGNYAFENCKELSNIEFPDSLRSLGAYAFYDCKSLRNLKLKNQFVDLGILAFMNSGLIAIDLSECTQLESINYHAFSCCFQLTSLILPPNLKTIEIGAFSSCENLKTLILPSTLKTLEGGYQSVFGRCKIQKGAYPTNIENVQFPVQWAQYPSASYTIDDGFIYSKDRTILYYAPLETNSFIGHDNLIAISKSTFYNCNLLQNIELPNSLNTIGSYAFYGCTALTSVEIPENVTQIGAYAFHKTGLKTLNYNAANCVFDSNTGAFDVTPFYKGNIEELTIGQNVNAIPAYAFDGNKISEIIIPPSVNKIGSSAFRGNDIKDLSFQYSDTSLQMINYSFGTYSSRKLIPNLYLGRDLSYNSLSNLDFEHIEIGEKVTDAQALDINLYPSLKSINSLAIVPPKMQPLNDENYKKIDVSVPTDALAAYCTDSIWKNFFNIPVEEIELPSYAEIYYKSDFGYDIKEILKPTYTPYYATDPSFTWTSSDDQIICISKDGVILTKGVGECVLSISVADNPDIHAECTVKVLPILINSIDLEPKEWFGHVGGEFRISAMVTPEDATDKSVIWNSNNNAVSAVDSSGIVRTLSIGEVDIIATAADGSGVKATCHVTVLPVLVESIVLSPDNWSGEEGMTFQIEASVFPDNATDKKLRWTSSDKAVAIVDEDGFVAVLKEGNCVITATATDGSGVYAECVITSSAGIDEIFTDGETSWNVYDINGTLLKKNCDKDDLKLLSSGIYILQSGNNIIKTVIR